MSFDARLAFAAMALVVAAPASAASKNKAVVGQPAPPFAATTLDKQKFALDALKGQVVVINRWATWCAPCKAEMPMMDRFYRRYGKAGLAMIGLTTEDSAPAFHLRKLDAILSYPLALRAKGRAYDNTDSVPTTFVIDRRGILRHTKVGAFDEAEFAGLILPLLAEKAE